MLVDWSIPAASTLGHVCLLVLAVNVSHVLTLDERWMDRFRAGLVAAWLVASAVLAWAVAGVPWRLWSAPVLAYASACMAVALIGLPVTTVARLLRRKPRGVSGRSTETDLVPESGADPFIGPGRYAWLLRLPGQDAWRLRRTEWSVEIPGLPPSIDGLSLLQFSDLHFTPNYERRYFEAVADELAGWEADLLLFTGDLIDHEASIGWIEPVLSRLRGRLGTFAILGNHDYSYETGRIRAELRRTSFEDLEGRWERLEVGGAALAIGGTSSPWGPSIDFGAHLDADLRIVLSHSPDLFYRVAAGGADLMLAGHNHGGQVRLPVIGPIFMPSRYSRRFDRGFFRSGRTLMYVNQGVGGKHPIRYNCPPEITRFVLRPARRHSSAAGSIRRPDQVRDEAPSFTGQGNLAR